MTFIVGIVCFTIGFVVGRVSMQPSNGSPGLTAWRRGLYEGKPTIIISCPVCDADHSIYSSSLIRRLRAGDSSKIECNGCNTDLYAHVANTTFWLDAKARLQALEAENETQRQIAAALKDD